MEERINEAVEVLKRGGTILYPTDTVWGIGCDAANPDAVNKVFDIKGNHDKKGMIVLVASLDDVSRYFRRVPDVAWQLLEVADKPLTLVLDNGCAVAENLLPDEGTLAIRIPQNEFCQRLLRKFRRPLVSTSANLSGQPFPRSFSEIPGDIINAVDYVADPSGDKGATGKPSSIIRIGNDSTISIIRE